MHKNSNRYKLFILLIFIISNTNHLLINIFIKNIEDKILPFLLKTQLANNYKQIKNEN
jgi:hypothetical protein